MSFPPPRFLRRLASKEQLDFNPPHPPKENAVTAFNVILPTLKSEIIKSRRHWDKHEPRMWSRAASISDDDLVNFTIDRDLVEVCSWKLKMIERLDWLPEKKNQ